MVSLLKKYNRLKTILFIKLDDWFDLRTEEVQTTFISSTENDTIEILTTPIFKNYLWSLDSLNITSLYDYPFVLYLIHITTRNSNVMSFIEFLFPYCYFRNLLLLIAHCWIKRILCFKHCFFIGVLSVFIEFAIVEKVNGEPGSFSFLLWANR